MSTVSATSFSVECSTLDTLCYTPAMLMICDIIKLRPLVNSRSVFEYNTHPITHVDILGFVTSIKQKDDLWICDVDDGTGNIQCYCHFKNSNIMNEAIVKSLPKSMQKRFSTQSQDFNPIINLGDFLRIRGQLRMSILNKNKYVANCKWNIFNMLNSSEIWLESLRVQFDLYQNIYDKSFRMDESLRKLLKSFIVKHLKENVLECLRPIIKSLITGHIFSVEFFGYEILDTDQVKSCIHMCFSNASAHSSMKVELNDTEKSFISSSAVASLLHKHVVEGHLIKRKCFKHEAVTSSDQLNARYFVTIHCKPVTKAVQKAVLLLQSKSKLIDVISVLQIFSDPDFIFIKFSKHGEAIIDCVLQHLHSNSRFFDY